MRNTNLPSSRWQSEKAPNKADRGQEGNPFIRLGEGGKMDDKKVANCQSWWWWKRKRGTEKWEIL